MDNFVDLIIAVKVFCNQMMIMLENHCKQGVCELSIVRRTGSAVDTIELVIKTHFCFDSLIRSGLNRKCECI